MKPLLTAAFVLSANRRDYTKRQWRRLWPAIERAARHHNINLDYVTATHRVYFLVGENAYKQINFNHTDANLPSLR